MKLLWVTAIPLPLFAEDLHIPKSAGCGWLTGLCNAVKGEANMDLHICFPVPGLKEIKHGVVDNVHYHAFPETQKHKDLVGSLSQIVNICAPDLVHLFGTENAYSFAMLEAFPYPEKTIVYLQGICSAIAKHFMADLPYRVIHRYTLRDLIKRENVYQQYQSMVRRGEREKQILKKVKYSIGRTDFDHACVKGINPDLVYYHCNENLRDSFYTREWSIEKCRRHSIFVSQAHYPIKGLHYLLEALPTVLEKFPDTHLYVAGWNNVKYSSLLKKCSLSSYPWYLNQLIRKYHLEEHITFTGTLDEQQMAGYFAQSHISVLPSSIENSPNSVGEAMLMGMPVIASDVGGVKNILEHNEEGFVYQHNASYMLAYYIMQLFENDELALRFSKNAKKRAVALYDRSKNSATLLEIYQDIQNRQNQ